MKTAPNIWKKPRHSQLSRILKFDKKYSHSVSAKQRTLGQATLITRGKQFLSMVGIGQSKILKRRACLGRFARVRKDICSVLKTAESLVTCEHNKYAESNSIDPERLLKNSCDILHKIACTGKFSPILALNLYLRLIIESICCLFSL